MKYVGDQFLIGIPARDLSDDEIKALAAKRGITPAELRKQLVASGLYAENKSKESEK